ncbi:MAG: L-lactate permease [Candidatus Heimdallarchaeaceae archaeon]
MSLVIDILLILLPFLIAFILLVKFKWKADTTGTLIFVLFLVLSIFYFKTDWKIAFLTSIAGLAKSFPISLIVLTSILMMTYMEKTGALAKIVVSFKKIGGGNKAFQIMIINLSFGTFLVSIGATPVTMLPPVLAAMGYSAFAAVALPSIGYDPLCTYALLAVPAVFFAEFMNIPLTESGLAFSYYMPLVSLGIALGMLYLAGGKDLLFSKDGFIFGIVGGLTTGGSAILSNYFGIVKLTGVVSGLITAMFLVILALIKKVKIIDNSVITEEEKKIDQSMSLLKAMFPWLLLILFVSLVNFIPFLADLFHNRLPFTFSIGEIVISTRFLEQAYFWVLVATILSIPILGWKKEQLTQTTKIWLKRSYRPVYAAAIYFAVAFLMIYSGYIFQNNSWYKIAENNIIYILATTSAKAFGKFYPLIVPFIGLLGGFVSGSETSSIAMFTLLHKTASEQIGLIAIAVGTANGVGGGLASVLSPAKIQNAAAVIDEVGIEGEVIKKSAPIALLMTLSVATLSLCWANSYIWWKWIIAFSIYSLIIVFSFLLIFYKERLKSLLFTKKNRQRK